MVPKIMTDLGIIPTAMEFMDQLSVKTSCEYLNEDLPYEQAGAMLLIEVDGTKRDLVEEEYELIGDLCEKNGAIEVYVAPLKSGRFLFPTQQNFDTGTTSRLQ